MKLTIPAGALNQSVAIELRKPEQFAENLRTWFSPEAPLYELGPKGLLDARYERYWDVLVLSRVVEGT